MAQNDANSNNSGSTTSGEQNSQPDVVEWPADATAAIAAAIAEALEPGGRNR